MDALLLVDLQNDFMPGGPLAVPRGDEVIPVANRLMPRFECIVATADWHPADHASFASNHPGHEVGEIIRVAGLDQILWPDHCIQNTPGAEFHPGLDRSQIDHIVRKGQDPQLRQLQRLFRQRPRQSHRAGCLPQKPTCQPRGGYGIGHRLLREIHRLRCAHAGLRDRAGFGRLPGGQSSRGR